MSSPVILCAYGRAGLLALWKLLEEEGYPAGQLAVFTHDRPENGPLLKACRAHGVSVSCASLRDPATAAAAQDLGAELLLSIHYRNWIPGDVVAATALGGMNLHPSLLPAHRGTFSVPWAILQGDARTGVSYHAIVDGIDEGDIVLQRATRIGPDETAIELFHRLIQLGLDWLGPALERFRAPDRVVSAQSGVPSYHPREVPYGGEIDPSWSRARIERFIRAMTFPPLPYAKVRRGEELIEVRSLAEFDRAMSVAEVASV